jgi:type IV secretory pathway VirJ component
MEVIIQGEGGSTVEGREMIEVNKKQVCFYGENDDDETACSCM